MIILERFAYTPMGTFGRLSFMDFSCFTIEKPWDGNKPYESCVPEGAYNIQKYVSPKFGKVFALYGNTVSVTPNVNYARSTILIHPANVSSDLEGCIGLGDSLGYVKNQWAVLNSVDTVKKFYDVIHALDNIPFNITFKTINAQ